MYAEIAHQLGYRTKLATRARAAYTLAKLLPETANPILHEVQDAATQALTGAFTLETVADLLQQENLRGEAATAGALTGIGRYLGGKYLPKRLFPGTHAKLLAAAKPGQEAAVEMLLRKGAIPSQTLARQLSAGRGIGALAGLATGLLAAYGVHQLKKPKDQK